MVADIRYARRSARVLLVDERERVLLLRFLQNATRPELGSVWHTPGGGVDDQERPHETAARELFEETGLNVPATALGCPIAHTSGHADLGWANGLFRDDFFFHRTPSFDVNTSGMEARESGHFLGHRWWTLDDLRSTTETVIPLGLVALLTELLGGRIPAQPVELPWHH